jgi:hypothetical protein
MNNWEKCIKALLLIIENPVAEKGYKDLINYYENNKMHNQSKIIKELINTKFKNDNDTNNN